MCLLCFALALVTVFDSAVAVWLGQVNQLIAIGVFLQLMALCTQKNLQYFLLTIECLWNKSSLQNFEAIVATNFIAPNTTPLLRLAILVYLVLPLGLGIAYKKFIGGVTTLNDVSGSGTFALTGPPGSEDIGLAGMALFFNATLPWWTNPLPTTGAFGFNLNVESNDRAALLDGPTPEFVSYLQSRLQPGDTMTLDATVNATVCDMVIDLSNKTRPADVAYWYNNTFGQLVPTWSPNVSTDSMTPKELTDYYWSIYNTSEISPDPVPSIMFGMMIPPNEYNWIWNSSFIMTSRWNRSNTDHYDSTKNETFGSHAQAFHTTRQKYRAEWKLTKTSIFLESANVLPNGLLTDNISLALIESNFITLYDFYPRMFLEYDWKYFGDRGTPTQRENSPTAQSIYIKSDTTLVAAMLWSRLTSIDGLGNHFFNVTNVLGRAGAPEALRYPSDSSYRITTPTLKRNWVLAMVLAVNPSILLFTLLVRLIWLGDAPISKDFGFASLLAGIEPDSLAVVKGASYSGKLRDEIRIKFAVEEDGGVGDVISTSGGRKAKIEMKLERFKRGHLSQHARNDRVKNGLMYE